ncbi:MULTISPECIES: hypothetical protein [unclassified Microcoleus]|uniref:hypothetical protein n=1 Tax=unclassified Microcoleus TaxID=2642155 RepID=UPI002FD358CB
MPSWGMLSAIAQEFNKSLGAFTPTYFPQNQPSTTTQAELSVRSVKLCVKKLVRCQ